LLPVILGAESAITKSSGLPDDEIRREMKAQSMKLLNSIGSFTVLNYEEGLREAFKRQAMNSGRSDGAAQEHRRLPGAGVSAVAAGRRDGD
jgi:hypothetical protein